MNHSGFGPVDAATAEPLIAPTIAFVCTIVEIMPLAGGTLMFFFR